MYGIMDDLNGELILIKGQYDKQTQTIVYANILVFWKKNLKCGGRRGGKDSYHLADIVPNVQIL